MRIEKFRVHKSTPKQQKKYKDINIKKTHGERRAVITALYTENIM